MIYNINESLVALLIGKWDKDLLIISHNLNHTPLENGLLILTAFYYLWILI